MHDLLDAYVDFDAKVIEIGRMDYAHSTRSMVVEANGHQLVISIVGRQASLIEFLGIRPSDIVECSRVEILDSQHARIDNNGRINKVTTTAIIPIANIWQSLNCSIQGKVIKQQPVYRFQKEGHSGKVCSITIADVSGSTQVTFWNEHTTVGSQFRLGDELQLHNLSVTLASVTYTHQSWYEYIKQVVPTIITDLGLLHDGMVADIVATVSKVHLAEEIRRKDGTHTMLAKVTVTDGQTSLEVLFWDEPANSITAELHHVVVRLSHALCKANPYRGSIDIIANEVKLIGKTMRPMPDTSVALYIIRKHGPKSIRTRYSKNVQMASCDAISTTGDQCRLVAWDREVDLLDSYQEGKSYLLTAVRITQHADYPLSFTITEDTDAVEVDTAGFEYLPTNKRPTMPKQKWHGWRHR